MTNQLYNNLLPTDFTGIPVFADANEGLAWIASNRWGNAASCPKCNKHTYKTRITHSNGSLVFECQSNGCRPFRFSPLIGTPLAGTKLPIHYWLFAAREFNKGYSRMSTTQLQDTLSISFVTAVKMYQKLIRLAESKHGAMLGEFAPKKSAIMKRAYRHAIPDPSGKNEVLLIPAKQKPKKHSEPWSDGGKSSVRGKCTNISPKKVDDKFSEDEAAQFFSDIRWGNGLECPTCKSSNCSKTSRPGYFRCYNKSCQRSHFNYKTNTPMMASNLTAKQWLAAYHEVSLARQGTSALEYGIRSDLSYKSAFYTLHRIRLMSAKAPDGSAVGPLEIDEMFVRNNVKSDVHKCGKRRLKIIIGARCRTTGNIFVECISEATGAKILDFVNRCTGGKKVVIFTDAFPAYRYVLPQYGHHHEFVVHQEGKYARPSAWGIIHDKADSEGKRSPYKSNIVHNNSMESTWRQVKSALVGVYRKISTKYLMAYMSEVAFRLSEGRCSRDIADRIASLYLNGIGKRTTYAAMTAG